MVITLLGKNGNNTDCEDYDSDSKDSDYENDEV